MKKQMTAVLLAASLLLASCAMADSSVRLPGTQNGQKLSNVPVMQQKKQEELMSSLENGDYILTSSGFYGTVIDITDDTVIVEFGNNKNCRIPMKKEAIIEVEKAQ